jgi:UDP-glucose 4-epimerase
VTGGAGYIGSVTARLLAGEGHDVLVVDDLSKGHRKAVEHLSLEIADIEDPAAMISICARFKPDACLHFAARSLVGESMERPLAYFQTNVAGSINLIRALVDAGCSRLVFSSTAAIYGAPESTPIAEEEPAAPVNVYGLTKLTVERMLAELGRAGQLSYASLRYFNAAGADTANGLGEDHSPETHLIPNIIAAALGREPRAMVFGTDYPTPDGTCVRDYIHVSDLAAAHVLALDLLEGGRGGVFNLGNGAGFSVSEVIAAVRRVSGKDFEVREGPRRAGDPPVLVASSERITSELGWKPAHPGLEDIVSSAWEWHRAHPGGYGD